MLVLYNAESPDGLAIAEYYKQVHPGVRLLGLEGVSAAEEVSADHYLDVIRPQVLTRLTDATEVLVTTKGLPLRIRNDRANPGTYPGWRGDTFGFTIQNDWWKPYSSLESELTRIDRIASIEQMGDQATFLSPPIFPYNTVHHAANPYYRSSQAFDRQDPSVEGMRLASRLDGFSVSDVKKSIDRAQRAFDLPSSQTFVLDDDPDAPAADVDRIPSLAFNVLAPAGRGFIFDNTNNAITQTTSPVIGLVSHGKHGSGTGYVGGLDFDIANGAVFHTWESFNAFSFEKGGNRYGQGLIAEWIEAGATGGLGHVQEPGASSKTVANEDVFWRMMLDGFTFAEAAWAATPQLSFVNTVVGDPLMRLRKWKPGDIDLDGFVGIHDLTIVLHNWNRWTSNGVVDGDLNLDGFIGMEDMSIVLGNWNSNPLPASSALPEPGSACLCLSGLFVFGLNRRAHRV